MHSRPGISKVVAAVAIVVVLIVSAGAVLLLPSVTPPSTSSSAKGSLTTSSNTGGIFPTALGSNTSSVTVSSVATISAKDGGTLVVAGTEPNSIQQADVIFSIASATIGYAILEDLVAEAPDGTFHPLLATSWQQENATSWIFHLRQGVKFSDGTDFNATAAVLAFQEHLAQKGWFKSLDSFVASAQKVDDYTMRVVNKSPVPPLEFLATMSYDNAIESPTHTKILCGDYLTVCAALRRDPVGTGPYELVSWQIGQYINATRNPLYWGPRPHLDNLFYKIISDPSTQLLEFQAGHVDVIQPLYSQVPSLKGTNAQLLQGLAAGDQALHFNYSETGYKYNCTGPSDCKVPWQSALVRKAMYYAIDRQQLVDTFMQGFGTVATGPMPIADSIYQLYNASLAEYPVHSNITMAKALLTQAGYPNGGFSMTAALSPTGNGIDNAAMMTAIQGMLSQVGITLNLQVLPLGSTGNRPMAGGHYDMALFGYFGNGVTPNNILQPGYCSCTLVPNGFNWYINSSTLDGYLATIKTTPDHATELQAINAFTKYYLDNAIEIQLAYSAPFFAVSPRVQGFTWVPYTGNMPVIENPGLNVNIWLSGPQAPLSSATKSGGFIGNGVGLGLGMALPVVKQDW